MFVELHIIQNFAPSNLNRDDTNNPKDAEFGGVRRARISSQCIKRSIRTAPVFAQTTGVDTAIRTRWIARLIQQDLLAHGVAQEAANRVALAFAEAYSGKIEKPGNTSVLIYLSREEIAYIVDELLAHWDEIAQGDSSKMPDTVVKDMVKATKNRTSAPDIALFGRMLADKPELNLDAACQVAHAISTHRVSMDMDFFTAVDDLQQAAEPGAGMMGHTGFNSATFYRYARIDWRQLVRNLNDDGDLALRTVEGFLHAAVVAIPTGKQNTFAAQNPPSFLLGVVRHDGMCWSLVNAFERPVYPGRDSGLVRPSILALDGYWGDLVRAFGGAFASAAVLNLEHDLELPHLAGFAVPDLKTWVGQLLAPLAQELTQ
ncbi:MAG TPA: type I-E CRISPR-associated protein Cas7/Cse4/CasC [Aggregatilineaceae bacterium]|jgi:CRISPR system Cascade subunit CasC|nr:type I-E CRISPR-associated protein Cas7/Cse4/CasC [Aggregatilineaceae bacterium]